MELRILLIHGDRPRDTLYRAILTRAGAGIDVAFAQTPEEVQKHSVPTVVLLDLDLRQPSSLEMLEWLRAQKAYTDVPVIALSSSQTGDRISRAYELGANTCVRKVETGGLEDDVARGIGSYAKLLVSHQTP